MTYSSFFSNLRKKLGHRRVAILFGLIYLFSQAAILMVIRQLPPEKVLILQTTFSQEIFLAIIRDWKMADLLPQFKAPISIFSIQSGIVFFWLR